MPQKHAVPTLGEQALFTATRLILKSVKNMINYTDILYKVDGELANAKLILQGQEIKQYFNSIVPLYLQKKLSMLWLKVIKLDLTFHWYECSKVMQIMTHIIFTARIVTAIAFSEFPLYMNSVLLRHLPCMYKLQVLDLTCSDQIRYVYPTFDDILNEGLFNMPDLQEFAFEYCTDSTIETIAFSCKMIQKMNVAGSRKVTNACIPALCLCENLKEFHFYSTTITKRGYEKLLIEHPRLETVDFVFLIYEGGSTYDKQDRSEYFESSTIFMKDLTLNKKNLRELSSMHPHITCLHISLEIHQLSILRLFPNVKNILIFNYDCKRCLSDLRDALKDNGDAITSLRFENAIVDLNTLFIVSRYCPNIIDLQFDPIFEIASTAPMEAFCFINNAPFQFTLKIRVIIEDINNEETIATRYFIQVLLFYCRNIKSIIIEGFVFDDEIMAEIILSNPLKQLEILMIKEAHLTMNSINLLMEHCDNLWFLQNLDKWYIDDATRKSFRQYLENNNINLFTTYYISPDSPDIDNIQTIYKIRKLYKLLYHYFN